PDVEIDDDCLDRRHVGVGSLALDHPERVRGNTCLIGQGDPDRLAAHVEAEHAHLPEVFKKIKALQGGLQGLGADRSSYLLPQVVGETSGMRGEGTTSHPPSRNVDYYVARGIRFSEPDIAAT